MHQLARISGTPAQCTGIKNLLGLPARLRLRATSAGIAGSAGTRAARIFRITTTEKEITMTNQQIRELYDNNPNMTLRELSRITGLSILDLKLILMGA